MKLFVDCALLKEISNLQILRKKVKKMKILLMFAKYIDFSSNFQIITILIIF